MITLHALLIQITKEEAYGPSEGDKSSYNYPPRYFLKIRPLENVEQDQLCVPLELNGTDDQRKFTLTNPPIVPTVPVTSPNQESEKSMYIRGSLA